MPPRQFVEYLTDAPAQRHDRFDASQVRHLTYRQHTEELGR